MKLRGRAYYGSAFIAVYYAKLCQGRYTVYRYVFRTVIVVHNDKENDHNICDLNLEFEINYPDVFISTYIFTSD